MKIPKEIKVLKKVCKEAIKEVPETENPEEKAPECLNDLVEASFFSTIFL